MTRSNVRSGHPKLLIDNVYPALDGGRYPVKRVEGDVAPGEKVKFFTKLSPNQAFPAKVSIFEPSRKMVLTGGMPLGLFKSERTHTLTANAEWHHDFPYNRGLQWTTASAVRREHPGSDREL